MTGNFTKHYPIREFKEFREFRERIPALRIKEFRERK